MMTKIHASDASICYLCQTGLLILTKFPEIDYLIIITIYEANVFVDFKMKYGTPTPIPNQINLSKN